MPRKAINYSTTIIYKIVCKDLEVTEVYVGHTTDFKTRKSTHKSHCNNENDKCYNFKVYKYIRENGGWENFDMIEIEKFSECKDSNEATARERYWIEKLNAKLNSIFPQRPKSEFSKIYREINKEEIHKKDKIYRENNKEKIRNKNKKYREDNKEIQKEQSKKWYEDNKEEIKKRHTQHHINKINTPYTCSCSWIGNEISKFWHLKNSIQHKEYLEQLEV
jgi:hypothetical protein